MTSLTFGLCLLAATTTLLATASASSGSLSCEFHANASGSVGWRVTRDSDELIMHGEHIAVHMENTWFVAGTATSASAPPHQQLHFISSSAHTGTDRILGVFTATTIAWATSKTAAANAAADITTTCKTYPHVTTGGSVVAFEAVFPNGANHTAVPAASSQGGVLLNWPAATEVVGLPNELSWAGQFVGADAKRTYGVAAGPTVFFDDPRAGAAKSPVIGFPTRHFKISSESSTSWDGSSSGWAPGVAGTLASLPRGFTQSFALYSPSALTELNSVGVTAATASWGEMMQALYNTTRVADVTLDKLEYQTDNGAQYCFCTEGCDQKILATKRELDAHGIKLGTVSFQGGWWTNKELHTAACAPWCVSTWEPNATKVPMGSQAFSKALGVPLQLYAPYFCMDTPYSKQYSMLTSNRSLPGCGAYNFKTPSPESSEAFYKWFMGFGVREWNMISFEPDFMVENNICVPEFLSDSDAAEIWMDGMATAAAYHKLPMQWCMASPTDLMQALSYPAVTNLRASTDYYYGSSWDIGLSSLLIWSLGAIPSKDTFWTSNQSDIGEALGGCPKGSGCPLDHSDAGCELHLMLAVLSTGPVGFSDAYNRTNFELLLRATNSATKTDGIIVKPSKPVTSIDSMLASASASASGLGLDSSAPKGHVLGTYCSGGDGGVASWLFVAHQLKEEYKVRISDFYPSMPSTVEWIATREWHDAKCTNGSIVPGPCAQFWPVSAGALSSTTIVAAAADPSGPAQYAAQLHTVVPVCASKWAVLGTLDTYASLSTSIYGSSWCCCQCLETNVHDDSPALSTRWRSQF